MKALKEHNFKIYLIIIISSLFLVALGANIYVGAKAKITELANKNKVATSENIVDNFQIWLDERINSLVLAAKFMENAGVVSDDERIKNFIVLFKQNAKEFDIVQLLREDSEIFVNGKHILKTSGEEDRTSLVWYAETKATDAPTVNFMQRHRVLNEATLNFCVPVHKEGKFAAAFCGVVKTSGIFKNISNFKLPPNSYSFLVTHGGEVLSPMKDTALKEKIERKFRELFLTDEDITSLNIGSNFISVAEIPTLNWFIGAGTDNEKELAELNRAVLKNALVLLFAFVALALTANFLHNFMYARIKKLQDEYEILLTHKAKMSEAGELISGINHQFIQPVNSLNLMISTLLMLQKDGKLDDENLRSMLQSGQKSVQLLSNTIEIFRNFYKTSENIEEFDVAQSVKNLLTLMHTELSRANVRVNLEASEGIKARQIENIIQQILLILIHNAKDAVVEKFKDDLCRREIKLSVSADGQKCRIGVSDFGGGVSEALKDKILTEPKTTKKQGSGIGLYFGKKLANEKINGDIKLLSAANPTTFELSFDVDLRADRRALK
ncbi:sensor histidine kinase [Campylobacter curvus]|nr:sensor histidine kinase [Campylobacter curvus]MDU6828284.1 sensor histidine kinase [Campylobacter sp.]